MFRFLQNRPFLPLFWKFSIAITIVVVVFGTVNYYLIQDNLNTTFRKELNRRLLFMSKTISEQITNSILVNDFLSMQTIINAAKSNDTTIKYILLINEKEEILAHSFDSEVPQKILIHYKCSDSCIYEKDYPMICENNNLNVFQISKPLLSGNLGYLYIGVDKSKITSEVESNMLIFVFMIVTFFIVGIIGAFVFSFLITKPIKTLEIYSSQINLEELTGKNLELFNKMTNTNLLLQRVLFRDEIDNLLDTYREMLIRLTKTHNDLQIIQTELMHSEKMSTIGVLAAGLAHDINNPIAGVLNSINRIRKNINNTEQTYKYLDLMEESAQKINIVIKNLMNFARKEEVVFVPTDIREMIENSLMLVSHRLNESNIKVTKKMKDREYTVLGSRHHLEQVFVNLLINSIDAIDLKFKNSKEINNKSIEIQINDETYIEVIILDNGIGIEKDKLSRVFEAFYTTKKSDGTGLGLSIVQNILNLHNAKFEIESEFEKWTKVKIQFQKK